MSADPRLLEAALGYTFQDRELLARALTHKSRSYEELRPGHDPLSNEQLEFLGDSILGFVVSASLYRRFPTDDEGRLSRIKHHLVSESRLYEVAQELSLGNHLILGRGEELSGGRAEEGAFGECRRSCHRGCLSGRRDRARCPVHRRAGDRGCGCRRQHRRFRGHRLQRRAAGAPGRVEIAAADLFDRGGKRTRSRQNFYRGSSGRRYGLRAPRASRRRRPVSRRPGWSSASYPRGRRLISGRPPSPVHRARQPGSG